MRKIFPPFAIFCFTAELIFILGLAGCDRKSGEALVIEKEHIAAREVLETPKSEPTAAAPEATPANSESEPTTNATEEMPEEIERPIAADEISVGQYVMRAEDRGTNRDPRATSDEQWLVTVRMIADGREFNVHADRSQFEKLNAGDRISVSYRLGKYTKTVWSAQIH